MKISFSKIENTKNSLYNKQTPNKPVVLNEGDAVCRAADSLVALVQNHLPEIMLKGKKDKERALFSLNLGFTCVQAQQWWTHHNSGRVMPGLMSIAKTLSAELKMALGLIGLMIVDDLRDDGQIVDLFFPFDEFRRVLLLHLAKDLGLLDELADRFRLQGMALVLGNATLLHFDKLNDPEEGHNWVVVASVIANVVELGWPDHLLCALREAGFKLTAFAMMIIGYTREIVGVKAKQLRVGLVTGWASVKRFIACQKDEEWIDVGLLRRSENCDLHFVKQMHSESVASCGSDRMGLEASWTVTFRPEAITKMFWYGSIVDGVFRFLFYLERDLDVTILYTDVIALDLFVNRECNGQLRLNEHSSKRRATRLRDFDGN
jgi:hypothetical protein